MTDGYNVSLRFIHIDQLVKMVSLKEKRNAGHKATKGFTKEERNERNKQIKENCIKHVKITKPKKNKQIEFPYIDEIDISTFKAKKFVVVDPGKRDLMAMMDENGIRLNYSNKQRIKDSKRLKYHRLLKNYRDDLGITTIENDLNGLNSKTCNLEKYKEYLLKKNNTNNKLFNLYSKQKFKQYKWYSYIETKRCEDKMLNIIESKYGIDRPIIYGDWSQGKQMRNFISTPNLGVKRKLSSRFDVYNIDEFRTSILHHLTEKKCENLRLKDKKHTTRKQHAILTSQMENNRLGCINRDYNSCLNLRKIFLHFLKTYGKERLLNYSRYPNPNLTCSNLLSTSPVVKTSSGTTLSGVHRVIYAI
jgi:hypothetical protein